MLAIIVAYAHNRVIGNKGQIPWQIDEDKKHFKELTTGNVIVMGRRTYEEIGRPLPNRHNIVVSTTATYTAANCTTVTSLQAALDYAAKNFPDKTIFICGGASLYREALTLAQKLYITKIDADFSGDTFFPAFNEEDYIVEQLPQSEFVQNSAEHPVPPYSFYLYTRKSSGSHI